MTRYSCPEDRDEVLFVDDSPPNVMKMMIIQPPVVCPRCNKAYYQWQCIAMSDQG